SAPIMAMIMLVAMIMPMSVLHRSVMMAFPVATALGFAAGLLPAPSVPAPIASMIVPAAVMPVSVVMGQQWPGLLAGQAGQGWPRVFGRLYRRLGGRDFGRQSWGRGLHLHCRCRAHCREREQAKEHHPGDMEFHE